jgi:excisionase family DNA binding protein
MGPGAPEPETLLTPAEVAALFRVDPKTVTRWAKAGKLSAIRTLGGHRRYRAAEVYALLEGLQVAPPEASPDTSGPLGPSGVGPTESNTPHR